MARRKASARVQVPVRMLEAMRAKLEKSAKARGVSLNGEIVGRLQQSLTGSAENYLTDLLGTREKLLFAMAIADTIQDAEKETGHGWLEDEATHARAMKEIVDWVSTIKARDLKEIRENMNAIFRRVQ
jgi:hypothetical protein